MKRKNLSRTAIYLVLSLSMLFMPAIGADVILVGAGDFTLPGFSDRIGDYGNRTI